HPIGGKNVDVIAIPVDKERVLSKFVIRRLGPANQIPDKVRVSIGADVQVIGYPLGVYDDVHNLPIVRNASMASIYPVPFRGNPCVLVDARLHSGTSGSPVMTKPTTTVSHEDGSLNIYNTPVTYLLGVHSATLDLKGRDPRQHEPLG